jgi:hypothetical protein
MPERETDRRRERGRTQVSPQPLHREPHPVLALQRAIGNRAVAQMLARKPAATGPKDMVQIHGVGDIKVTGGNLDEWTGNEAPNTVELTSQKGRHSAKLEKLADAGTKTDVEVTIAPANKAGEQLSVGGGTVLEIKSARITDYEVDGGAETWRLADFTNVHRTKITHRVA